MELPIPICRPRLPLTDAVLPYLRKIDQTQTYSNFGPLVRKFENAFAAHCRIKDLELVTAANGTLAIQAALMAQCGSISKDRNVCLLPSFTFAGTISAVTGAGLSPMFVDVHPETGMIDLDQLLNDSILQRTAAIVIVGAFGRLPDLSDCAAFENNTGIPIVVDAAGCSDALLSGVLTSLGPVTMALSFHATKAFGIGEGGGVVTTNRTLAHEIRAITNFGLDVSRVSQRAGFNGKMSEYGAAVGLALLDQWQTLQDQYRAILDSYRRNFAEAEAKKRFWFESNWITTYPHLIARSNSERLKLVSALQSARVDTRRWWMEGCHTMPAYAHIPRFPLPNSVRWIHRLVGLPFYIDLDDAQIGYIAKHALPILLGAPESDADWTPEHTPA